MSSLIDTNNSNEYNILYDGRVFYGSNAIFPIVIGARGGIPCKNQPLGINLAAVRGYDVGVGRLVGCRVSSWCNMVAFDFPGAVALGLPGAT